MGSQEIIQLRVIKEDFNRVGETFLCAFQVLHSTKISSSTSFDKIKIGYVKMCKKQGISTNDAIAELENAKKNDQELELIIAQLNDTVQDELCKYQHKYSDNQDT